MAHSLRMPTVRRNIRERPDGRFVVRYRYGRKNRRKLFESREQAADFVREERRRLASFGTLATELTGSQLGRLMALAVSLAKELGDEIPIAEGVVQIEKAVQFWRKYRAAFADQERGATVTIAEAVEEMRLHWRREEKNPHYVANATSILRRFAKDHPKTKFGQLTPARIQGWILGQSPGIRITAKARISALYSYAILHRWTTINPCALFKLPRRKRKVVEIPRAKDIEAFLRAAREGEWRDLVPYFAIRLFAGLRKEEALHLEWRHIDHVRSVIIIPDGIAAKNGAAREVPMAANLAAWLLPYKGQGVQWQIAPLKARQLEADFRKANSFVGPRWFNALRHCFGSYRYPQLQSLDRLAEEMGNSRRVLSSHYVGAVVPEDVAFFWKITP